MSDKKIDVLIVEDEHSLAILHAELVSQLPGLHVTGIASTLAEAVRLLEQEKPDLLLLDNYLPDGQGISLLSNPLISHTECSFIFITAASDMNTCGQAIRHGAFDYILKPVSLKRLSQSLTNFIQFCVQQRDWKVVDQKHVDSLYQLKAMNFRHKSDEKGIEETTLELIKRIFPDSCENTFLSVDEVMSYAGLSKTTTRRYLEYCVRTGFLDVGLVYGKIGHPRRKYRRRTSG